MPNLVTTEITGPAEILTYLTRPASAADANPVVDFRLLIPEPADTSGLDIDRAGWRRLNWGTQSNAFDVEITHYPPGMVTVQFTTAWTHPGHLVQALSERVAGPLIVAYADEVCGYNLGWYRMTSGVYEDIFDFTEGSWLAGEFASRLVWGEAYASHLATLERGLE